MVTAGGPYYARLREMDVAQAVRHVDALLTLTLHVARVSIDSIRSGGSLLFISGTGARRPGVGLTILSTITAAMPALIANLALELAPVRVKLVAPGFVDTPLSAALLADDLDKRRQQLRETLPIRRVVGPADVAALAFTSWPTPRSPVPRTTSTAASSSSRSLQRHQRTGYGQR